MSPTTDPPTDSIEANADASSTARPVLTSRRSAVTRWWPAALIVVGTALLTVLAVSSPDMQQQMKVVAVQLVPAIGVLLLWLWFVLLGPLAWSRRWRIAALLPLAVAALLVLFRWDGFNGDLWLQFSWRWRPAAAAEVRPAEPGTVPELADLRATTAQDFPQFLGDGRRGEVSGVRLARDWQSTPPRLVWRREVGAGWSSFAVVGQFALTQEQRDAEESIVCYHLPTGGEVWRHREAASFASLIGGDGPRATPTVVDGRVYALGATGILCCLDGADGQLVWRRDVLADHSSTNSEYGMSSSPLVTDGLVIVGAGSGGPPLAAYDAATGEKIWSGGHGEMSYSSPTLGTLAGVRQLISLNANSVSGHDVTTGRTLWHAAWPGEDAKVPQPVVWQEDALFVSSGFGVGCALFDITLTEDDEFLVSERWRSTLLKTKFTTAVIRADHVFGLDDGILTCLDLATGDRRWKRGRYGHGQVLLVDDVLLVQSEYGEVALVEAHADGYRELTRFQALSGDRKAWTNPALAGPYLLVRDDREAACFELPVEASAAAPE